MKLKVIGSGNLYSSSNSASYLIDNKILIDVPNGICKTLKNMDVDFSKITDLLITHFHGDHFFDLPFFLLYKMPYEGEFSNIYCTKEDVNKVYDITKLAFRNKAEKIKDYFKYVHDNKFKICAYDIEKILVNHSSYIESYGYVFHEGDKYIGFTGDSTPCNNIEEMASKCQHLICDCNDSEIMEKKSHISIDDIKKLAIKFPNCIFYTTHMHDITREKLKQLNIKNIVILKDGDEFIF